MSHFDRALAPLDTTLAPIVSGKLLNYIQDLNVRQVLLAERHEDDFGRETEGIALLKHILFYADADYIRTAWDSDFDRWTRGIYPILTDLKRIMDPVTTGVSRADLFIEGRNVQEILIPVDSSDPFDTWPMDEGWEKWQNVRPLRLLDVASSELTFHVHLGKIKYRRDIPETALFSLDVGLLLLQYVSWLEAHGGDPHVPIQVYLFRHVFLPVIQDLGDVWLRDRYLALLTNPSDSAFDKEITGSIYNNVYGYIGLQYAQAMRQVLGMIQRVQKGSTTPLHFLSSLRVMNAYVPEYCQALRRSTYIPVTRQTYWTVFLRDLPWLRLVWLAYRLNPGWTETRSWMRTVKRDLGLLKNLRIDQGIHSTKVKARVQDQLIFLNEILKTPS